MHPALVTVNRSYRTPMTEERLAELLKKGEFPEDYPELEQVEVFFSEVPVSCVLDFCREYGISLEKLRSYYERHIKDRFRNEELEEVWKF